MGSPLLTTALHGWENSEALDKHVLFIRGHQGKVKRIAVIAGYDWQRWIAAVVNILVHPQIQAFSRCPLMVDGVANPWRLVERRRERRRYSFRISTFSASIVYPVSARPVYWDATFNVPVT